MGPRHSHQSAGPRFALHDVPERDGVRLALEGELDVLATRQVRERVAAYAGAGFGEIVLDLRGVTFIDSTGMRLLVGLHHQAHRDGWDMLLIQGPENVQRVFEIAGTRTVLPFAPPE